MASSPKISADPCVVTVNVQRNQFCPVFQSEPYAALINQTQPISSVVLQPVATDNDDPVRIKQWRRYKNYLLYFTWLGLSSFSHLLYADARFLRRITIFEYSSIKSN